MTLSRSGMARSQNQNHPDYLTQGCQTMLNVFPNQRQSVNLSCTLNPCVSISLSCHVSIPSHRHLMQISDRVSPVTMQHDTDWHSLNISPLPWCCHVHQARPLVRLSRGAQLGAGQAVACDAATQATIESEERQRGHKPVVSPNFGPESWADFNNNSQHSTCWPSMIQYEHLMIRISRFRESQYKQNNPWFEHSPDLGVLSRGYEAHNNSG